MNHNENDFKRITRACCEAMGVDYEKVFTRTRKSEFVITRQIAMLIIRQQLRASLTATGRFFFRDHCTVLWAEKSINNQLDAHDSLIIESYNACMKQVRNSQEMKIDEQFIHNMNHMPSLI